MSLSVARKPAWFKRKSVQGYLKSIVIYALVLGLSGMFLFPLFWMVTTSVKPDAQIYKVPPQWIPDPFVFDAYPRVYELMRFPQALWNTMYLAVLNIAGVLTISALVAYGFARIPWRGRQFWFIVLLATMMIPHAVTMVPIFIVFNSLGWVNTFKPLIVPAFLGQYPFYIFLLRQFFMTIPNDLSDAARIDGCSELGILFRVILPLAKPALSVVAIFHFMGVWNDFLGPLIYLHDPNKYTLGLALYVLNSGHQGSIDWSGIMAASTLQVVPVLLLFFFTQRYFIEGVTLTGMKG